MASSFISNNVVEGADALGIGTYTVPVYAMSIQYPVKLPTDSPDSLLACVFNQTGSGGVNAFISFTIEGDGTLTVVTNEAALAPSAIESEVKAMPLNSDVYSISSTDYNDVLTLLDL